MLLTILLSFFLTTYSFNRSSCFSGLSCKQYDNNGPKIRNSFKNRYVLFIGDSITRFQYLDLVYTLRYGYPQKSTDIPCITHLFEDRKHDKWNMFFTASHDIIGPNEIVDSCNCHNGTESLRIVERWFDNRYYYDPSNNIRLTYLSFRWFAQGRIASSDINKRSVTDKFKVVPLRSIVNPVWKYDDITELLYKYVGQLKNRPNVIVLNFGHWHNTVNESNIHDLVRAANIVGDHLIWKTTTYARRNEENVDRRVEQDLVDNYFSSPSLRGNLTIMNTKWTQWLDPSYWPSDRLHFKNPVYSALNDQLADIVNKF